MEGLNELNEKVYIIILNWNGWKDTIECIESLQKSNYRKFCIVIVDNDSSDNSIYYIKEWANNNDRDLKIKEYNYSKSKLCKFYNENLDLVLIKSDKNLGFAGGNNIGIEYALSQRDSDYIWVLNNDVIVEENCIFELVKYSNHHKDKGVIGSTIIEYYDPTKIQYAGGASFNLLTCTSNMRYAGIDIKDLDRKHTMESKDIDYVGGCSMFFRHEVLSKIGKLSEDYFLYFEEIDYSMKLKESNYKIGWCKDSHIYHKCGSSIGSKNIISRKSTISEYYSNLSAMRFIKKHYNLLLPIVMINRFILKSIKNLLNREFYLFNPLIKSYKDFIFNKSNS